MKPTTKELLNIFNRRGASLVKVHGNEFMRKFHANEVCKERKRIGSKAIRLWLLRGLRVEAPSKVPDHELHRIAEEIYKAGSSRYGKELCQQAASEYGESLKAVENAVFQIYRHEFEGVGNDHPGH
jgi:hypothetical protein